MSHTLNSYQIELPDISPLSFLSKSVLMQHIFCVEANPHNGVEAIYLTVSKLMAFFTILLVASWNLILQDDIVSDWVNDQKSAVIVTVHRKFKQILVNFIPLTISS